MPLYLIDPVEGNAAGPFDSREAVLTESEDRENAEELIVAEVHVDGAMTVTDFVEFAEGDVESSDD